MTSEYEARVAELISEGKPEALARDQAAFEFDGTDNPEPVDEGVLDE